MTRPVEPQHDWIERLLLAVATVSGLMALTLVARAADDEGPTLPVTATVKTAPINEPEPEPTMQPMVVQPDRPEPTLPGGRLPQYQLGYAQRQPVPAEHLADPRVFLQLTLPEQDLLIAATITIDGQPFRTAREQRVQDIVADLNSSPDSSVEEKLKDSDQPAPPSESEDGNRADVESSDGTLNEETTISVDGDPIDASNEARADEGDDSEDDESEEVIVNPPTEPAFSDPGSDTETARRYLVATGLDASVEQVDWLLTNRISGPSLLWLNGNFQRFRNNQRPLCHILDRNRDGVIADEEIAEAVASIEECDLNRDAVVTFDEIQQVAADPRFEAVNESGASGPLFRPIPPASIDETSDADVTVTVSFHTDDPSRSTISITHLGEGLSEADLTTSVSSESVAIVIDGRAVQFSARQRSNTDQVSVGAVLDGYPLLPEVDPNDDGRLTIRERRLLVDRLQEFDLNRDGQLTADEMQPPVRVAFALGPIVHGELAGVRRLNQSSVTPSVTPPEWFVRMDRNRDNDLTRSEFPGTDEQFAALDTDADALVSPTEAIESEQPRSNEKSVNPTTTETGDS